MSEDLNPFADVHTFAELFGLCFRHGGAENLRDVLDFFKQQGGPVHPQNLMDASADLREVGMIAAADVLTEYAEKQPPFDYRLQCPFPEEEAAFWLRAQKKRYPDLDESQVVYSSPDTDTRFDTVLHKCPEGYHMTVDRDTACRHCGKVMKRPESIY